MKIYVRAHDIGKGDANELAIEMKKLGFDGLQLAINKAIAGETATAYSMSKERLEEIANSFLNKGLEIVMLGSYFNPVHSNKNLVENNILKFKDHLSFANIFKTNYVGSETGSYNDDKWTYNPLNRTDEAFSIVKKTFKDLAEYAKTVGSNIAIEGADGHCMYEPKQLKKLISSIDNNHVFAIVDVYNYLNINSYDKDYQHKIIDECLELFGQQIKIFHIKDFIVEKNKMPLVGLGEGLMDLPYIISKIKAVNPDANLIFEGVPKDKMESSLAYINNLINQ